LQRTFDSATFCNFKFSFEFRIELHFIGSFDSVLEIPVHQNFLHSVGSSDSFNCCEEFFSNFQIRLFNSPVITKILSAMRRWRQGRAWPVYGREASAKTPWASMDGAPAGCGGGGGGAGERGVELRGRRELRQRGAGKLTAAGGFGEGLDS
jgi:hypothetical protein